MKTPALLAAVDRDLEAGHAAVIRIVSTGEALMERRLAEIPTEEWGDVQVDITPREYVLDYLAHGFPTQLFEPFTDGEGNLSSRPVYRDGQPVQCREAVERRDRMIERLASLAPVQGALDQIVQRFGTEVKAEKRFLSTIARRLDTLGAITKGQRQTGGQGLFRADDNLESVYGRAALRQLCVLLYSGKCLPRTGSGVEGCSFQAFEDATGLRLTDGDGSLREDLPPITTFLNRLLALTINLQNTLFGVFEDLLRTRIEGAIASGAYDLGVETVTAESLIVTDRRTLYVHPLSGAETQVFTIARRDPNRPFTLAEALHRATDPRTQLLVNSQSRRAAVQWPSPR